jgi:hypothetical protein
MFLFLLYKAATHVSGKYPGHLQACPDSLHGCLDVDFETNCEQCTLLSAKFNSALLELKSAREVISILQEDLNKVVNQTAATNAHPSTRGELFPYDQTSEKWSPVRHKLTRSNKPTSESQRSFLSANRFAALANLHENYSTATRPMTTITSSSGQSTSTTAARIPTIVNGKLIHSINKDAAKRSNPRRRVPNLIPTKPSHIVSIIGDSHLRNLATNVHQFINSKYEISSIVKPGAKLKQIVLSNENELKNLGKKYSIVINGGTNDLDMNGGSIKGILASMIQFCQKYDNTNIIVVNMPHRCDLTNTAKTNIHIQTYNNRLLTMLKKFKHVTLTEMPISRGHFTRQGLHLNKRGKEWLAKQIAANIETSVKLANRTDPAIPLMWKEEETNLNSLEASTNSTQASNKQNSMFCNDPTPRISTRLRKAPATKTNDFLW